MGLIAHFELVMVDLILLFIVVPGVELNCLCEKV